MVSDAEMVFDLTKRPWHEHLPKVRGPFATALLMTLWHSLQLNDKRCADRGGYLALAGAGVLPDGPKPDYKRIKPSFDANLSPAAIGLFLLQQEHEAEMKIGETEYGPYRLMLLRGKAVDKIHEDVRLQRWFLRDILVKEVESAEERNGVAKPTIDTDVTALFANLPESPEQRMEALITINQQFRGEFARLFAESFNTELRAMLTNSQPNDYDKKKAVVAWVRERLDAHNLAISRPDDHSPCNLITLPGYDEKGVFLLEGRGDRRRSHTTHDLTSLLDLALMDAGPRVAPGRRLGKQ